MEDFAYIGWIPCINGHLDFGLMRVGIQGGFTNSKSIDNKAVELSFGYSPFGDSHDRRIVLQSKVDWRDSSNFPENSGQFRVIVTAEVNKSLSMDERYLSGNLLIYPLSAEPENRDQRTKMNVHALCHDMEEFEDKRHELFNALEKITSAKEPVDNLSNFSCSIRFEISPSGITKLQYNSKNSTLDEESKYLIARQAFYYLKYSIHTHKHHTATQDSLTTITPVNKGTAEDISDAGLRLICQLKRELTSLQRTQNTDGREHPTNNAVGIIAYIKSLILSLQNSSIISHTLAKREQERFKYIDSSFIAQNCKMSNQSNNIELIKSKSKVWLGFILISLWGILNFALKPSEDDQIAISSSDYWIGLIVILATLFFIYSAIKRYYNERQSASAPEYLYHLKWYRIPVKIILTLFLIFLLLYVEFIQ